MHVFIYYIPFYYIYKIRTLGLGHGPVVWIVAAVFFTTLVHTDLFSLEPDSTFSQLSKC